MSIKNQDVWVLKSAKVLMERYHYSLIDVRSPSKEIWLSNTERPDFQVVRLSAATGFMPGMESDRIRRIYKAISTFFNRQMELLDVRFDTEEEATENEEDIVHITVTPQGSLFQPFLEAFPDVQTELMVSEDPQQEYNRLQLELQKLRDLTVKKTKTQLAKEQPWATYTFFAICALMTLLVNLLGSKYDVYSASIFLGAYYKTFIVVGGEYWRFLSAGFIHIDFWHFLMNGIALLNIGLTMEKIYGWKKYSSIMIVSIIVGCMFVFIGQGNTLTVGISGGLYGCLGALLIYSIETNIISQPAIRTQLLRIFAINLLINFLPNVSWLGHMGGFVAGVMMALMFSTSVKWKQLRFNTMIAFAVMLLAFVPMTLRWGNQTPLYAGTDTVVLQIATDYGLTDYADSMRVKLNAFYTKVGN